MNELGAFRHAFDGIAPYGGPCPADRLVDYLGTWTDAAFRAIWGDADPAWAAPRHVATRVPVLPDGEAWFEGVNWVEAAREARGSYVMMTLGACYGGQAVRAWRALQQLNPLPARLVAVEAEPENLAWMRRFFRDNDLDPDEHWLVEAALSDRTAPVLFPVGAPGCGAQNCAVTNDRGTRALLARRAIESGNAAAMLQGLLLDNTTGATVELQPGAAQPFRAELRLVSAVTLADLLAPFDRVDYVEADLQQSEAIVFPPAMAMLSRKVRRVHLGTHGDAVHAMLEALFRRHGWEIVFSYPPETRQQTPWGGFALNDGVLTAVNPVVAYR